MRAGWAVVVVTLACSARAEEVLHTDGGVVLEVSGFVKTLVSPVWLRPALVAETEELARAFDEARQVAPPGTVPQQVVLPSSVLFDAHVLRVSAKARVRELVSLDVAWQLTAALASDARFSSGASLTGTIGGSSGLQSASRRLVELSSVLSEGQLRVEQQLDRLSVRVALPFGDLTVGRQVLSWGTGRVWNPTDVLSPFPPTVVDREVRRGFDAVRLAVPLGATAQLDVLYLPQQVLADQGAVARVQANVKDWDVSFSAGKYVKDLVVGADLVGDVGPVAVHAEGAYTLALEGLGQGPVSVGEHFFRGVVGADWRPHEKVLLLGEYHFNGYGASSPDGYAAKLSSARVRRGEVFGAGQHFLALVASWAFHDLASLAVTTLANLQDPSVLFIPTLEWSFAQTVLVRFGANLPLGAVPDLTLFRALTGADVLTGSANFVRATSTAGLRSEYGASPFTAFVQLGLHVP